MLAVKHPAPCHANSTTYYKQFEREVKDSGIDWPIRLQQIPKFEKMNG